MMLRNLTLILISTLLISCAGQAPLGSGQRSAADSGAAVLTDVDHCRIALQAQPTVGTRRLDQARMRLLNWNTQKNEDNNMAADLQRLTAGVDLILLQETVRQNNAFSDLGEDYHWSFSPGFKSTGVMTASRIAPLAQCSLTNYEPWLQTPKATGITEFALSGTNETLLVVNVHLINFTFGVDDMRRQLLQALSFVEQHNGPVIVSGDFNTWRKQRRDIVVDALQARGLRPVGYTDDYRKRFMGNPLDHTFVRGVSVANGTSHAVESSDHNPTSFTLEF